MQVEIPYMTSHLMAIVTSTISSLVCEIFTNEFPKFVDSILDLQIKGQRHKKRQRLHQSEWQKLNGENGGSIKSFLYGTPVNRALLSPLPC